MHSVVVGGVEVPDAHFSRTIENIGARRHIASGRGRRLSFFSGFVTIRSALSLPTFKNSAITKFGKLWERGGRVRGWGLIGSPVMFKYQNNTVKFRK